MKVRKIELYQGCDFQTFNALKSTSFQAFQTFSDFFSKTLSHPCCISLNKLCVHWRMEGNHVGDYFCMCRECE